MPPSQLILWSQGRTACHLLERMLSAQPNMAPCWHPFLASRSAGLAAWNEDAAVSGLQDDLRQAHVDTLTKGVSTWESALKEAKAEGKMLFVHEHPQFALTSEYGLEWGTRNWKAPYRGPENFTAIPKELLLEPGTCAIFTIRHPAWIVDAACRAMKSMERSDTRTNVIISCNLRWQRQLYDFYVANGVQAIIVEAEDYMTNPDFTRKLCKEAGLDPEHALFNWPKATDEEKEAMGPLVAALLNSLINSTGLIPSKAKPPPVLDDEYTLWKEEFGEERATLMRELTEAAMEDYEYLRARKLRL